MKFLEAKGKAKPIENKMQPGTRPDQGVRKSTDAPGTTKKEVVDLAKSLNVNLLNVAGTGRNGEITLKDVKDAKAAIDEAFKDK